MNISSRLGLVLAISLTIALGACSSAPKAPESSMAPASAPASAVQKTVPSQSAPQAVAPTAMHSAPMPPYLDPQSLLFQKRSIYFDYDQATLKPESAQVIELHGKYLAAHPSLSIKVQGNTDERGGTEYNLALGQRRADAVAKALKVYGVKDSQLEAVSFGKEKPKAMGHDEAAFSENRRVDLAYPDK